MNSSNIQSIIARLPAEHKFHRVTKSLWKRKLEKLTMERCAENPTYNNCIIREVLKLSQQLEDMRDECETLYSIIQREGFDYELINSIKSL